MVSGRLGDGVIDEPLLYWGPRMPEKGEFGETTNVSKDDRGDGKLLLLVMVSGGVMEFDLAAKGDYTVGRAPNVEIHIDAPSVSRAHALLSTDGTSITVQDLKSTNGTHVNGETIGAEPVPVHVGDAIRFGDVVAQLRGARASRIFVPKFVRADEFDTRIAEEAERCVRYDRSLAAIAIETASREDRFVNRAKQVVAANLRALDAATMRAPGRIDVLTVECDRDAATEIAGRIFDALASREVEAKVGVAAYPSDVPSPDSLLLAAQFAMHSVEGNQIGNAREGARMLKIGSKEIIVSDPSMVRLFGLIERVAGTPVSVLVHGETGSGKEIVAEAIHVLGPRVAKPLIKINCAAMPENLLESELFGHEKGAFSGADRAKPGLFEEAHTGTIFLDEIGEMSPNLQAKLLRVLEDSKVRRVGATKEKQVDVRVVAATHKDLKALAAVGEFRQDLFYRLSAIVLRVPPLRERPREVPLLAERFAAEASEQAGRSPISVSSKAMAVLRNYEWPGNIRELRNAMNTAVMMCDGAQIDPEHLPPELSAPDQGEPSGVLRMPSETIRFSIDDNPQPLELELRTLERARIEQALKASEGNQTKAAGLLGMPRRTLVYKISSLGIDVPKRGKRTK